MSHAHGSTPRAHDARHAHDDAHEAGPFTRREAQQARRLVWVLALISTFFFVELAGAFAARSNVLKADALHLFMDVLALAMSLVAMRVAVRRPTSRFTFGLRRAEPVAGIVNATLVLGATAEIVRRAVQTLRAPEPPEAGIMLVVAAFALIVNGLSAWLLHGAVGHHGDAHGHHGAARHGDGDAHGKGHDLNVRGARLHLLGDTLGSVAAIVAALVIRLGGPAAADPLASIAVAVILVAGAGRLLRDAALVLLEAAPPHLPVDVIRAAIRGFEGVSDVHDMHVWSLGAGHDAACVHVVSAAADAHLGARLAAHLREKFKLEYVTVQVERDDACDAPASKYQEP